MTSFTKRLSDRPRDGILRSSGGGAESELEPDEALILEHCNRSRDAAYLRQFFATSLPLWLADQTAIGLGLVLANLIAVQLYPTISLNLAAWFAVLSSVGTITSWLCGLYPAVGITSDRELRKTSLVTLLVFSGALVHATLSQARLPATVLLLGTSLICFAITPIFRRLVRRMVGRYSWWSQPTLIFGGGDSGKAVYQALSAMPECGLRPIGIVDDLARHWQDSEIETDSYLGPCSYAPELIKKHVVFRAVVPLEENEEYNFAKRINQAAGLLPHLSVTFADWTPLARHTAGEYPLIGIPSIQINEKLLIPLQRAAKRSMDLLMLAVVGLFAFPVIGVLSVLVYLTSPGPIFFTQTRVGMGGGTFRMWKFRSMVVDAEKVLKDHLARDPELREEWNRFHKLKKDPRVTRIGRFLRKTSLDELPQIFNILRGDMSFVGPRPYPIFEYDDMRRFAPVIMRVRPGVTGLWQVSGRSRSTFEERLRIDAGYVRDWSPWLDLYILSKTIRVVLTCEGAC